MLETKPAPEVNLSIARHFGGLPDPRIERTRKHALADVLLIALCAVIAGADTWADVEAYGRSKLDFFKRYLALPNGVPSHDTFNRVFAALDPAKFSACFGSWMTALCQATGLKPIAIDGKAGRRSKKATASGCLHLVSAWAVENHLVLGQREVAEGSNEIPAIPELLAMLDLRGALVSIDAIGCQVEIVGQILDQEGDYLVAVKGNQPGLLEACEQALGKAIEDDFEGQKYDTHSSEGRGHGREEERHVTVIYQPEGMPEDWPELEAIVVVSREREAGGKESSELAFYVSSYAGGAREMGQRVRGHWGVENNLHWVLDVAFREDECRTGQGHAGANLAMLRRVAVSLLKRAPGKHSIHTKRLKAAWDDSFLLAVLGQTPVE